MLCLSLVVLEVEFISIVLISSVRDNGDVVDFRDQKHIINDSGYVVQEFLLAHGHDLNILRADLDGNRNVHFVLGQSVDRMEYMTLVSVKRC